MDKRGVKIMKTASGGHLELRANDQLTATIVTSKPPRIMTEKQMEASLAKALAVGPRPRLAPAHSTAATPAATSEPSESCPRPPALCRFWGSWALRR
jgi:hypothetical protein